jgi:GTP-binding protein YchF
MKVGIVGLPNVGKSSLFNFLTSANAQVANFPFTTIDRNVGMIAFPDERLDRIVGITKSPKKQYAHVECIDIAGLIKGASKGDGLGNTFLSHIRDVDLVLHVLRCFEDVDVPHTDGTIVPQRDYEIVRTELFLADLAITERRINKIKKKAECREELLKLEKIRESLSRGIIPEEVVNDLPLLTTKPEIKVLNYDEDGKFRNGLEGYKLSVKLEEDIVDFTGEEKSALRKEAGVDVNGISGLLQQCLHALSNIIFYTIKGEEARAWTIKQGASVWEAAGKIHSDIQEGFIKAEVLPYHDFISMVGFSAAQHEGKTKIEGKEYIVQDGDIILIKFRK